MEWSKFSYSFLRYSRDDPKLEQPQLGWLRCLQFDEWKERPLQTNGALEARAQLQISE